MIVRAYLTHKKSEHFSDCQDRFGVNADTKSIAVSDGMGSTWQQKIWAQILVDTFTQQQDWLPNKETIKPLCHEWKEQVVAFIQKLKEANAPENMIFRNERSLAEGRSAGATFVGIRFQDNNWNGCVLGDSCLVEWDGAEAVFHTSQDVDEFDSYPDYFDSHTDKEGRGNPRTIKGTIANGSLLLVSDPFSDFLLEHKKQGDIAVYINQILELSSHEEFENLVDKWRNAGMHNDDTTLVIVQNDGKDEFSLDNIDKLDVLKEEESRQIKKLEESITNSEDNNEKQPLAPKESFSPSEDEKDFITEIREWLDQSLKKFIGKRKAKDFLKRFFNSSICKIIQRYKITKR